MICLLCVSLNAILRILFRRSAMSVIIRIAAANDIPRLAELWHEKMVLLQQTDMRFVIPNDPISRWSQAMSEWLQDNRCAIYLAESQHLVVGYVIGWLQFAPFLLFDRTGAIGDVTVGVISEIVLDTHSYHAGVARTLLQTIRGWFAEQGVENVVAYVPHNYAVEQAFWRSVGATQLVDVMWIKS